MRGMYKRGNVWWIIYAGPDGKMLRESSRTEKHKDALGLLMKRKQEVKDGKLPEVRHIQKHTLNELAKEYLVWAERQRSFKSKVGFVRQLCEVFGGYNLRQITPRLVEQYQTERLKKGNKPATANRHLATLKHMFTKAVEWYMVEEEAAKRIQKVKLIEEANKRIRFLSFEECDSLLNECDGHLRPIVTFALNTGMRKEEILSLMWEQVDLVHGLILLNRTKNGELREVPINITVREALRGLLRRVDVPYVFFDHKTGPKVQGHKKEL